MEIKICRQKCETKKSIEFKQTHKSLKQHYESDNRVH